MRQDQRPDSETQLRTRDDIPEDGRPEETVPTQREVTPAERDEVSPADRNEVSPADQERFPPAQRKEDPLPHGDDLSTSEREQFPFTGRDETQPGDRDELSPTYQEETSAIDQDELSPVEREETPGERDEMSPVGQERLPHRPGEVDETDAQLFESEATERFRTEWQRIQATFVDDPREAVRNADQLVDDVIQVLTERKHELEGGWQQESDVDTEELRLALRRYRSFVNQLLNS